MKPPLKLLRDEDRDRVPAPFMGHSRQTSSRSVHTVQVFLSRSQETCYSLLQLGKFEPDETQARLDRHECTCCLKCQGPICM